MALAESSDDYEYPIGKIDKEIRCKSDGTADERACMDAFRGIVNRAGDKLTIKLDNGKTKVIQSNSKACQQIPVGDCVVYELVGFVGGSRQFVIRKSLYESFFVDLVSRSNGFVTKLEGFPHVSPSGRQFVTVAASDAWAIDNPIAIYSNTDPPRLLWWFPQPREYEQYSFDGWDGEDRLKLHTTTRPSIGTDVRRVRDGWALRRPNGKVSRGKSSAPGPNGPLRR